MDRNYKKDKELEFLKPPLEQKFWSIASTLLNCMGAIDRRIWGFSRAPNIVWLISIFLRVFGPISIFLFIFFLVANRHELHDYHLQNSSTVMQICFNINIKLILPRRKIFQECMSDFFNKMHLYHFKTDSFVEEKIIHTERNTRWIGIILTMLCVAQTLLWLFMPIFFNNKYSLEIANGTMGYQTMLYMWMPFDYEHSYRNWVIMHIFNGYCFATGLIALVCMDAINYTIILHLIAHIQLLKRNIRNVEVVFVEGSEEDMQTALVKLTDNTSYVLRTFLQVEDAFATNVTLNYIFNLCVDSVMVYNIMVLDATHKIMYGAFLVVFVGGLVLLSVIVEEIQHESAGLPDALYDLPWECLSVKNRRIFLILLMMCQRKLHFRGSGGMHAGLRPMLSIFKSTFSFYSMLRARI